MASPSVRNAARLRFAWLFPKLLAEATPQGDGSVRALRPRPDTEFPRHPRRLAAREWTHALRPCALAAVVALGLTALGLNPFVAALGAGFLAVAFYRRRSPGVLIRSGSGARLGAVSGILFFAMSTVLELLAVALLHKGAEIRSQMLDKIQQAAARYPGPEVQPLPGLCKNPRWLRNHDGGFRDFRAPGLRCSRQLRRRSRCSCAGTA